MELIAGLGEIVVISSTPAVRKALFLSGMDELVRVEGDRSEDRGG